MTNADVGSLITSDAWFSLGIPGVVLLIILIVVLLMFRQQATSINKLCDKLDSVVTTMADNTTRVNESLIIYNKDQQEMLRLMSQMQFTLNDIHKKTSRIDARVYDQSKKSNGGRN